MGCPPKKYNFKHVYIDDNLFFFSFSLSYKVPVVKRNKHKDVTQDVAFCVNSVYDKYYDY